MLVSHLACLLLTFPLSYFVAAVTRLAGGGAASSEDGHDARSVASDAMLIPSDGRRVVSCVTARLKHPPPALPVPIKWHQAHYLPRPVTQCFGDRVVSEKSPS